LLAWQHGTFSETPRFDAAREQYIVNTESSRWFAGTRQISSEPVEMRLSLSLQDWEGYGGIMWGLDELDSDRPAKRFHCFFAEYHKPSPMLPAKLAVREVVLEPQGIDHTAIIGRRIIAVTEVELPKDPWAMFEVVIEAKRLRIRFDKYLEWEVEDLLRNLPEYNRDWLPANSMQVGLTAQCREAKFRDFSVRRFLPNGATP
jgi:hypothetical protein